VSAPSSAWQESARRYNLKRQAERRQEWTAFHRRQAVLCQALAEQHRDALGRLIDGKG
jgi:hypothetical protein